MKTLFTKILLLALTSLMLSSFTCGQNGPTKAPSVLLSWTEVTTPSQGLTGFWVYRSTTAVCAATAINPTAIPATTFTWTDTEVSPGDTYYYCMTAAAGVTNSPYSDMVSAVIPVSPSAPVVTTPTIAGMIDLPSSDNAPRLTAEVEWK